MSKTHLIIPDAHAKSGVSNERFDWLGRLIMDRRPDVIVCLGDFYDMPSLSSYDKGTGKMEGRRYSEDLEAGRDALRRIYEPISKYNRRMAKNKKKQYSPRMVMTVGNHEARINVALNQDPWTLEGIMSMDDLRYKDYGWQEVYPYLERVCIDGVTYTHCVQNKNSAMMIGGMHHGYNLLQKLHTSTTVGHSHLLDFKTDIDGNGNRINGLVAGCYFDHHEDYANQSNKAWWRGITIKHGVHNGDYDPEFITLTRIQQKYG